MIVFKKWLFRIILLVVFIVALIAATGNSQEVALTFLGFHTPTVPLSWWVLAAFVVGVLFGMLVNFFTNTQLRMTARRATKAVEKTSRELDKAKSSPSK